MSAATLFAAEAFPVKLSSPLDAGLGADWSLGSSNEPDSVSAFLASTVASSLAKRLQMGEILACSFGRIVKGEEVVIERGFERKEASGETIARNAERRMRCLFSNALGEFESLYSYTDSHYYGLCKKWGRMIPIVSSG